MTSSQLRLLVVDDDEAMREVLRRRLAGFGHLVDLAPDGEAGVRAAAKTDYDAVLTDVVLPDLSGLDLLRSLKSEGHTMPVILITAHATVDLAVEAMKEGARDFLTKPLDFERLEEILATLGGGGADGGASDGPRPDTAGGLEGIVGESPAIRAVFSLIREIAGVDASVLVTGESGTGKELVARALHELGARREGPFVAINSAAIPSELMESEIFGHEKGAFTGATGVRQGCFELAHGGTLFLDEVAEMPVELQPKLLRVLEDGRVRRLGGKKEFQFDTRVVAATNRDPQATIDDGALRKDLYYRLNVFSIELPPLRERGEDLRLLFDHFIAFFGRRHGVETEGVRPEVFDILEGYGWPGNIRELRNVSERAVVLAGDGWIEPEHLPAAIREPGGEDAVTLTASMTIADAERELILKTLEETDNNKAEAARRLGIDVKTVRNKLKSYGIELS